MGTTPPDQLLGTLERLLAIQATDLKGTLDQASQSLAGALAADKIDLMLHDPASDSLVALGVSDTPMGRRQRAIGMDRLPLANGGRLVEVYRTGRPYLTGRAEGDPEVLRGFTEGMGVRSMVGVPLDIAGVRRGILHVASATPDRFDEGDLAFLVAVAGWVGMVAQQAELVERLTAEAAERARRATADELIAALAHDLRSPLQAVSGRLGMLRSRARREGHDRNLEDAEAGLGALARVERMIVDLLDANRLEQGLFALSPQPVDLCVLVTETAELLQTDATPVAVRGPEEVPAVVDTERVRQALENLLANAVRHAPQGTPVEVTVATEERGDGAWATIAVRDAGPGVSVDLRARLFERFAAGPDSRGLGLGLYLARGIAAAHGGTLTLDGSGRTGTTFQLTLSTHRASTHEDQRPRGVRSDGRRTRGKLDTARIKV